MLAASFFNGDGIERALKRSDSLKRKKEFRYTYRVGKSQANRYFALVFAQNRIHATKLGFSVSKKIGNSVVRNRTKRRMREAATPLLPLLKEGYNLILIARSSAVEAPFPKLGESMNALFRRAGLMK